MIIKKSDGFSLMELMIVVAIVGIASLIAIPQFLQWRKDFNLKGSARDLMGFMQKARLTAVKERVDRKFTVDSTGFDITDKDDNILESWSWKDYVYLVPYDSGNEDETTKVVGNITFSPNGFADADNATAGLQGGHIVLKSVESAGDASSSTRKRVKVSITLAGSITIESL